MVTTLSIALAARHRVSLYSEFMCADNRFSGVSSLSGGAGGNGLGGGGLGGSDGSGCGHGGIMGGSGGAGAPSKIDISATLTYRWMAPFR